jgi:tetratricopeptide (TPR) repeat protein
LIKRVLALAAVLAAFLSCSEPPPARSNPQLLHDAERSMLQGQWEQAAGKYEQFLSENPGDPQRIEVRAQIGKCRLAQSHPEQAIRAFDQALTDGPASPLRWEILFRRAVAYRMQGDAAKAVEGFRAVAAAPASERGRTVTNDELHYEYATSLFRAGNFSQGQVELKLVSPTGPFEKQVASRVGLSGYTIQVAAYGREELARQESERVNGRIRVIPSTPPLFQVMVGSYTRYDDAQRELARLLHQGYTDAFILP